MLLLAFKTTSLLMFTKHFFIFRDGSLAVNIASRIKTLSEFKLMLNFFCRGWNKSSDINNKVEEHKKRRWNLWREFFSSVFHFYDRDCTQYLWFIKSAEAERNGNSNLFCLLCLAAPEIRRLSTVIGITQQGKSRWMEKNAKGNLFFEVEICFFEKSFPIDFIFNLLKYAQSNTIGTLLTSNFEVQNMQCRKGFSFQKTSAKRKSFRNFSERNHSAHKFALFMRVFAFPRRKFSGESEITNFIQLHEY